MLNYQQEQQKRHHKVLSPVVLVYVDLTALKASMAKNYYRDKRVDVQIEIHKGISQTIFNNN